MLKSQLAEVKRIMRTRTNTDHDKLAIAEQWFEPDWYLSLYPDVASSPQEAKQHFFKTGYLENRSPHPLFDPEFYFRSYTDVADSGIPAILHYIRWGGAEGRQPCAWVDMDAYAAHYGNTLRARPHSTLLEDFTASSDCSLAFQHFDSAHYRAAADLPGDWTPNRLLVHFFSHGLVEGLSPHPLISTSRLALGGGTKVESIRRFRCLFEADSELHAISLDGFSDPSFFVTQYGAGETHPCIRYLRDAAHRLWPHPLFDPGYYHRTQQLPEHVDPLAHYLEHGRGAGARPNPYFDPPSYCERYAHHFKTGEDALDHYMESGHQAWFETGAAFGQRFYLTRHPEVAPSGIPALVHYLHYDTEKQCVPLPPTPWFDPTIGLSTEEIVELIHQTRHPQTAPPLVTVIVPVYEQLRYTLRCVQSLLSTNDKTPFEVLVTDDSSADGSQSVLRDAFANLAEVAVHVNEENLGFLQNCNEAVKRSNGKFIYFLNNDTAVLDGWLDELIATFRRCPSAGLVGPKLIYANGLLQEAGGIIWKDGSCANFGRMDDPQAPLYNYQRDADYISGAAILVPRSVWNDVGGFSPDYAPAYYEDTDLAMKIRAAGKRVIYQPMATVLHYEGVSSGRDTASGVKQYQAVNQATFIENWRETLSSFGDPGDFQHSAIDRAAKARVLVFDAEIPKPDKDSGSVTAFQYVRILCELGYRVTFVPEYLPWQGRYGRDLQRLGAEVLHTPYVTNAHQFVLERGVDFDLFILSRATTGGRLIRALRERYPEKPIIFDTVDVHHLRLERQAELGADAELLTEAEEVRNIELAAIQHADATIIVSEHERQHLVDEIGPFGHITLPLIYEPYERDNGFEARQDIAFVGGFRHPPNIDAVHYLIEEIWPAVRKLALNIRLHIVGSHMPSAFLDLADDDIQIVGYVENLEDYLKRIRLTVAPLRYGAGVKGKVGNSLRMGVPVVGSEVALEGMGLRPDEHVLTANSAQDFAAQVKRLYTDPELWEFISRQGQRAVLERFGTQSASHKLGNLVRALLARSEA